MCITAHTYKSITKTKESSVPSSSSNQKMPWCLVMGVVSEYCSTGEGCLHSQDTPTIVAMYIVTTSDYVDKSSTIV